MLTGLCHFSIQIIALDVVVCHFRSKILCRNSKCGQEISKWTIIFDAKTSFHIFCGMASEKDMQTAAASTVHVHKAGSKCAGWTKWTGGNKKQGCDYLATGIWLHREVSLFL